LLVRGRGDSRYIMRTPGDAQLIVCVCHLWPEPLSLKMNEGAPLNAWLPPTALTVDGSACPLAANFAVTA